MTADDEILRSLQDEMHGLAHRITARQAEIAHRRGEALLVTGDLDGAEEAIPQLLRLAHGDHQRGQAHALRARVYGARSEHELALPEGLAALRLLDRDAVAEYDRAVRHMAWLLGSVTPVKTLYSTLLQENRRRQCRRGGRRWAQHRWLEGIVRKNRHQVDAALAILAAAQKRLFALGDAHDGTAVGVDLIDLHLRQGIRDDARRVAADTLTALEDLGTELPAFRDLAAHLAGDQPLDGTVRRTRDALLLRSGP